MGTYGIPWCPMGARGALHGKSHEPSRYNYGIPRALNINAWDTAENKIHPAEIPIPRYKVAALRN